MNKRQKKKAYKKHLTALANDGRVFKSEESKEQWIRDTLDGFGTAFTNYHLKGYPESHHVQNTEEEK